MDAPKLLWTEKDLIFASDVSNAVHASSHRQITCDRRLNDLCFNVGGVGWGWEIVWCHEPAGEIEGVMSSSP